MLNVKSQKVINVMLDMLDLDTSTHVRAAVLKALIQLAPNHAKVKKMSVTHWHLHAFSKKDNSLKKNERNSSNIF
jgi:hypothetical protein